MRENQRPLAERGPGPFRGRGLAHPPTLLVVADLGTRIGEKSLRQTSFSDEKSIYLF